VYKDLHLDATRQKYNEALNSIHDVKKISNYMIYLSDSRRATPASWTSVFTSFIVKQRKYNKLTFEDLILITIYILQKFEDVRAKWQNKYAYVMVDEGQDNNENNWDIASVLSGLYHNLMVVGDPDQSIYGWRGARADLLTNMEEMFPSVQTIILNQNYRSYNSVLLASNHLIQNNTERIPKDMVAVREGQGDLIWHHAPTEAAESAWICKQIRKLSEKDVPLSEIAVLYRIASCSRVLEESLVKEHIPYIVYGGVRFYERREIKDVIAYLKLIAFDDDLSFKRIINTPKRSLGPAFVDRLQKKADAEGTSLYKTLNSHLAEADFRRDSAKAFCELIDSCRSFVNEFTISDIVEYLLDASGIRKTLVNEGDDERMDSLKELISSIKDYEEAHADEDVSLQNYLQEIALYTNLDRKDKSSAYVKLMTIHQAKGLEFSDVFICAATEGVIPAKKSLDVEMGIEEERRVMYVAMTRAKNNLYVTDSDGYSPENVAEKQPSRFIAESKLFKMSDESVAPSFKRRTGWQVAQSSGGDRCVLEPGYRVKHPSYGWGTVRQVTQDNESYMIEFEHYGIRSVRSVYSGYEVVLPPEAPPF
jgi:DNA helicase-2/ATP-dependent DNA helicase PcrA